MNNQYGFYFDQTRCIGCFTCVIACKDWHDIPAGPASWLRIKTTEKGQYPDLFVSFLWQACYQCEIPSCLPACPVDAITKRKEDGIVIVNRDACLGKDSCGSCLEACDYDAPQFGAENNPKMQKCDLCLQRWVESKKPVCVAACPALALDAGPIDKLRKKYGNIREADGFEFSDDLVPSVTFRPKKDKRRLKILRVSVNKALE